MRGGSLWLVHRIAACDFKLTWKERSVVLWMFVMPLAFTLVFGMSFRRSSGSRPTASLTIDNRDGGFLSLELIEALESENLSVADSLEEGESSIRTLTIPAGFTEDVLRRDRVKLLLSRDESANIEANEAVSVAIYRGLIRIVGGLIEVEAEELGSGAVGFRIESDSIVGSLWNLAEGRDGALDTLNVRLDSLQARESIVSVNSTTAGKGVEIPSGFQGSVPGNLVMFVLMSMVFSGTGIAAERSGGILKRLGMSPAGKGEIVFGKLLGRMWVALIQIAFLLLAGRILFSISLGNSIPALVCLMIVFAFCTGSFGILFGSLFKNPDQVAGFAIITTLAMAAFGGCWWPIEVVGRPFKIVAFCLPTGWAINGLHKVISFGYGFSAIALHILALAAFGALFMLLASKRLKWAD